MLRSPHPRASADVLQRLTLAKAAQLLLVIRDVADNLVRVGPGILAQRPADRLPQKELPGRQRWFDTGVEQRQIGLALERVLADDRGASLPEVVSSAPGEHGVVHRLGVLAQQRADPMG